MTHLLMRQARNILAYASVGTFAVLSAVASGVQGGDSVMDAPHISWRISELVPAIASRIHITADRVPAFPREKRELRDARKWPKTTVIGGLRCILRVQELGGDYIADLKSLDQLRPGAAYGLHYEVAGWTGWKASRGPSYYWRSDGRLYERSWRSPDTTRSITDTYQYYTSGELLRHSHRNDSLTPGVPDPQGPYEWFDEVFARNGDLVACGYSKMDGAGARTLAFYVLGKGVGYDEFQSAKVDFIRRAPH